MNKNLKYNIQPKILASKLPKKLGKSAYGYSYDSGIFAGLPASNMKGKWIQFTVSPSGRPNGVIPIGDIGPWNGGGWNNKFDDPYWRKRKRPQAETGRDLQNRPTDKCGIQFSHTVWKLLGLKGKKNIVVDWHFVVAPKNKLAIIINNKKRKNFFP